MGSLLNDWIQLFDEKDFESLNNEPNELRRATMLFLTIQKEFKRVENSLVNKLQDLKSKCEKEILPEEDSQNKELEIIELCSQSPPRNNAPKRNTTFISPTFSRHRKPILKKSTKSLDQPKNSNGIYPPKGKFLNSLCTPNDLTDNVESFNDAIEDEDIFDSSIVGITPNLKPVKKLRSRLISPRKTFSSKSETNLVMNNTTLTPKFGEMVTRANETKENDNSMMDIDEILGRIDSEKTMKSSDKPPDLPNGPITIKSSSKNHKTSCSFVRDYDKVPERHKSPVKLFPYKETVRGKERKKLKGWSCKECEQFYKGLNLSEEELEKKMDECSKHRSRFRPEEETMPGYWDLSIPPTPEDQKTQLVPPTLSQESIGNESTIFLFYKK